MSELTKVEQEKIIEWITCDGQAKGILEDEFDRDDVPREVVEEFIAKCGDVLFDHLSNNEM